jgi:hypothetical protein
MAIRIRSINAFGISNTIEITNKDGGNRMGGEEGAKAVNQARPVRSFSITRGKMDVEEVKVEVRYLLTITSNNISYS